MTKTGTWPKLVGYEYVFIAEMLKIIPKSSSNIQHTLKYIAGSSHTRTKSDATLVKEATESLYEVLTSLAKLGVIMAYFYLCDR